MAHTNISKFQPCSLGEGQVVETIEYESVVNRSLNGTRYSSSNERPVYYISAGFVNATKSLLSSDDLSKLQNVFKDFPLFTYQSNLLLKPKCIPCCANSDILASFDYRTVTKYSSRSGTDFLVSNPFSVVKNTFSAISSNNWKLNCNSTTGQLSMLLLSNGIHTNYLGSGNIFESDKSTINYDSVMPSLPCIMPLYPRSFLKDDIGSRIFNLDSEFTELTIVPDKFSDCSIIAKSLSSLLWKQDHLDLTKFTVYSDIIEDIQFENQSLSNWSHNTYVKSPVQSASLTILISDTNEFSGLDLKNAIRSFFLTKVKGRSTPIKVMLKDKPILGHLSTDTVSIETLSSIEGTHYKLSISLELPFGWER